jgi:hypothetical protein
MSDQVRAGDMRLAKRIRIERNGLNDFGHIFIDGELFPYMTADGPTVNVRKTPKMPGITLTIQAESVEVVDEMYPLPELPDEESA